MYRTLLASTAIAAFATPAVAETIANDRTQPVSTSTIKNGSPDSITITKDGSVTVGSGTAVTMDSDHAVTNEGEIAVNNANGGVGIEAEAGTSGKIENSGTIKVLEPYSPTDEDKDGDIDGPFALGSNRYGIRTNGAHDGALVNSGTIEVEGNDSAGIWLGGELDGKLTHNGKTSVLGDRSVAIHAGDITGDVRLAGTVTAIGEDAVGAHFSGDIDGALVVQGTVGATGYRKTTAPTDPSKLDADDLLQGGSALVIEGNVAGGILLAAAPKDNDANDKDEDDDGIDDDKEGTADVVSYGAAPAMVIGSTSDDVTVGPISALASKFGLQIDGRVTGQGVYSGVDANGLVIGGQGGDVTIANGVGIAGAVSATSKNATATAVRIGDGAHVPQVQVTGSVTATTGNAAAAKAVAVQVDTGADLPTIRNSGSIKAVAGADGTAVAIVDLGGNMKLIENSGVISATGAKDTSSNNIAIDLTANTSGATVKQTQVGASFAAPSIVGDVRFGSGADTFSVADGTVKGTVSFGAGNNTLALSGDAVQTGKAAFGSGNDAMTLAGTSLFDGTVDFGGGNDTLAIGDKAYFKAGLINSEALAVTMTGGALDIAGSASIGSLSLNKDSMLVVTLDKDAGEGTSIAVGGTASFADGATLGIRLADVHDAEGRYTVLTAGTLEGVDGIETNTTLIPYLFKATVADDAAADELAVDIALRTTEELGLSTSQADAFDAVIDALDNDEDIEGVFLGITDGDAFRHTLGLIMPDHAGGAFRGVSQGVRTMAQQVQDPLGPVYDLEGFSIILNYGAWGSNKDRGETAPYDLFGMSFSAAGEIKTDLGSFGASIAWLWNEYTTGSDYNKVLSNTYELAGYWRGEWGGLTAYGRGAIGRTGFDGRRSFVGKNGDETIERKIVSEWNGTTVSFNAGAAYEDGGQYFYFRPAVSVDYVKLSEDGYTDTGGGEALDLTVDARKSDEFAVNGGLTLGVDLSGMGARDTSWFRVEGEGGWREIVGGSLGSTTARFEGGDPFTLDPELTDSGWFAALRAIGGNADFNLGSEVRAEDYFGNIAYSIRGSLRMSF